MAFEDLDARFAGVVTSHEDLRAGRKAPADGAAKKVIDHIDEHCAKFIAAAPLVVLGSRSRHGWLDVSPKGDPAGFVRILDAHTLAVPDRLGNNRHDTLHNLIDDPALGLIFIVPQRTETLRVSGRARIVRDEGLRQSLAAANGKAPDFAIVLAVERVMYHCGKCMIRSKLWQPEEWPDTTPLSSLAAAVKDHARLAPPVAELDRWIAEEYRTELY